MESVNICNLNNKETNTAKESDRVIEEYLYGDFNQIPGLPHQTETSTHFLQTQRTQISPDEALVK